MRFFLTVFLGSLLSCCGLFAQGVETSGVPDVVLKEAPALLEKRDFDISTPSLLTDMLLSRPVAVADGVSSQRLNVGTRFLGVNVSPLIANLLPFNNATDFRLGSYSLSYLSFNDKGRLFRLAVGLDLTSRDDNLDRFNLRIGRGKSYPFHRKWTYYRAWDFMTWAGNRNVRDGNFFETTGWGVAPTFGLMFHILPNVYLSTETYIAFTFSRDSSRRFGRDFVVDYVPPFNVFLNINFRR